MLRVGWIHFHRSTGKNVEVFASRSVKMKLTRVTTSLAFKCDMQCMSLCPNRCCMPKYLSCVYTCIYISFFLSLVKIFLLASVRVVTSDMNGGMNVCVNDMRASERTCERMYPEPPKVLN